LRRRTISGQWSSSIPIHRRPRRWQTAYVVPLPPKGSQTMSPGHVETSTTRSRILVERAFARRPLLLNFQCLTGGISVHTFLRLTPSGEERPRRFTRRSDAFRSTILGMRPSCRVQAAGSSFGALVRQLHNSANNGPNLAAATFNCIGNSLAAASAEGLQRELYLWGETPKPTWRGESGCDIGAPYPIIVILPTEQNHGHSGAQRSCEPEPMHTGFRLICIC